MLRRSEPQPPLSVHSAVDHKLDVNTAEQGYVQPLFSIVNLCGIFVRSLYHFSFLEYLRINQMGAGIINGDDPASIIQDCLEKLQENTSILIQHKQTSSRRVRDLKEELESCREIIHDQKDEIRELNTRLRHAQEHKYMNQRAICLIDGDGMIFTPELIAGGREGGQRAARMLNATIQEHIGSKVSLWVYIFFNKRGLWDTLLRTGQTDATKKEFEDFYAGFNQADQRFMMVDVGRTKEAADARLKVYLEDNICLPNVTNIIFGGCHDNGYAHMLNSAITQGYKDKLLLLASYSDLVASIQELRLPCIRNSDLFINKKLAPMPKTPRQRSKQKAKTINNKKRPTLVERFADDNETTDAAYIGSVYIDSLSDDEYSETDDESESEEYSSEENDGLFLGQHSIGLAMVVEPHESTSSSTKPCNAYYLAKNCHKTSCRYSHDCIQTPEQLEKLRSSAKKTPCPSILKGKPCQYGDDCFLGHSCPFGPKCIFRKKGTCRFSADGMHEYRF